MWIPMPPRLKQGLVKNCPLFCMLYRPKKSSLTLHLVVHVIFFFIFDIQIKFSQCRRRIQKSFSLCRYIGQSIRKYCKISLILTSKHYEKSQIFTVVLSKKIWLPIHVLPLKFVTHPLEVFSRPSPSNLLQNCSLFQHTPLKLSFLLDLFLSRIPNISIYIPTCPDKIRFANLAAFLFKLNTKGLNFRSTFKHQDRI